MTDADLVRRHFCPRCFEVHTMECEAKAEEAGRS